jgi:hypothetical protein
MPFKVQWTSHTDDMGFRVSMPVTWEIRTDRKAGRIALSGPEGQRVIIWPAFVSQQINDPSKAAPLLQQMARSLDSQMS